MAEIILAVLAGIVIGCIIGVYGAFRFLAYAMMDKPDKFIEAIELYKSKK